MIDRAEFLRTTLAGVAGSECFGGLNRRDWAAWQGASVHDVRAFGARGDGRTDDGPAIQRAIDAIPAGSGTLGVAPYSRGGVVYVPASQAPYVVGRTLEINKSVTLTGDGPGSMLYLADGVNAPMLRITHGADRWVVVSWLSLEGNRFNQAGMESHGVLVDAGVTLARYHDLFLGLYVRNFRGSGLEFVDGAPHRIVNCTFNDNSVSQVHHGPRAIDNYVLNTIVGTDAAEPDSIGWWCEGSTNLWMGGAAALSGVGMLITGLRNSVVGGTSVDSNRREGIVLRANETRINGAVFRNNSTAAHGAHDDILIDGTGGKGFRNVISGCVIDGARLRTEPGEPQARYGLREVNGAAENRVVGCVVTGHTDGDVLLVGRQSFADHRTGQVAIPYAPEVTLDAARGSTFVVQLDGNVGSSSIVNGFAGQQIRVVLRQDRRGGRQFGWPANVRLAGGSLSLAGAGRADAVTLEFDGVQWLEIARSRSV